MLKIAQVTAALLAWLYAALIAFWLIWRQLYGDSLWWLALVNAFAPFLFAPLVLLTPFGGLVRTRAYWLGLALPILAFLLIYGAQFFPQWPAGYSTNFKPLKIMTFNIWGESRSPETARVILQNDLPDIVAVQELSSGMFKKIMQEVGQFYPYQVFDRGSGDEGLGVFSRYPLTKLASNNFFEQSWQIQFMRVQVGERTFILYNCHPRSSNILRYLRDNRSVSLEVTRSFAMRAVLVEQLMTDIAAQTEPVVVVGDFNSTPQSDVYRILRRKLLDSQQEAGWGLGHTFPAQLTTFRQLPLFPRLIRIDMILHSAAFVALANYVSQAHGESDHLPVIAELAWQ